MCSPETAEWEAAAGRHRALDTRVRGLRGDEPVSPLREALAELRASRCYERSVEHREPNEIETAAELRDWWTRGGGVWLQSYLHPVMPGQYVMLPPSVRRTLHLAGREDSPIAELLCPREAVGWVLGDMPTRVTGVCGALTLPWLRAAAHNHTYWSLWAGDWAVTRTPGGAWRLASDGSYITPNPLGPSCANAVAERGTSPAYPSWRACVEAGRSRKALLPAGVFEAPSRGWLATTHLDLRHDECRTRHAYHLETGAAYSVDDCPDRSEETFEGFVSEDRVREATLMSIVAVHASFGAPALEQVPVPDDLSVVWPVNTAPPAWVERPPEPRRDHETTIQFEWWDGERIFAGSLRGPDSGLGAEAHASELHFALIEARRPGDTAVDYPRELWSDVDVGESRQ